MIPVIDLFAGPGGLGEGFSALEDERKQPVFKITLSIEMEELAHKTLQLRSFFRQFKKSGVPEEYYDALRGKLEIEQLYDLYQSEANAARDEAWQARAGRRKSCRSRQKNFWALVGQHRALGANWWPSLPGLLPGWKIAREVSGSRKV